MSTDFSQVGDIAYKQLFLLNFIAIKKSMIDLHHSNLLTLHCQIVAIVAIFVIYIINVYYSYFQVLLTQSNLIMCLDNPVVGNDVDLDQEL